MSRRDLLAGGAMIAAATAAGQVTTRAIVNAEPHADESNLNHNCIDAHSHVWTSDVARYSLATGFQKAEMQPPSFTPADLLAHARPCGVARAVLIQMSYYGTDNRYMLDALREYPGTFSAVAVIDPRAPRLLETMRDLKRQGVRGFRIHPPGGEAVGDWLGSEAMSQMWKYAASEQLAMCALINPNALAAFYDMCRYFPDTTVVIDHFARIGIDGKVRQTEIDELCRLARHPRVYVKTSAFYALGNKQAPYTDLGLMIQQLLRAFGRERLMWATDCPYQVGAGHNYRDSIELIRSRLDFLTDDDRRWLLRKTAERVFFA